MANPVYLSVDDVWAINDLILRAEGQTSLLLIGARPAATWVGRRPE